jgi:hypothetical protein
VKNPNFFACGEDLGTLKDYSSENAYSEVRELGLARAIQSHGPLTGLIM